MCCGNKTKAAVTPPAYNAGAQPPLVPGADGMLLIEYVGGNAGKMSFYGAITKTRYVAGGSLKKIFIDVADAVTGIRANPGLLELADHGAPIFVRADA
jgi:hypothetical protein